MTLPHQALYRRWRAQTFSQIVGQEPVVTTLRNAVRAGRVAHALLFVGPRGTGKTSMARIVAKALNCTNLQDGEPCDTCPSCIAIREGRALDVAEMDAASNNKVDDIRELLRAVATGPSDLRRKVFIIDEVQRIREGWDVLLKTLEEPPDHVAFIFCTTDSSQIRPAVLSRVQRFDFRRLTVPQIAGKLRSILDADDRHATDDAIRLVAEQAAGGMRDAESMLDQLLASGADPVDDAFVRDLLGLAEAGAVSGYVDALAAGDAAAGLEILDGLETRGRDLRVFLDQVVDELRRQLIASVGAAPTARAAVLAASARRLASIDPTSLAAGGLRLQLELPLFRPVSGDRHATAATSAGPPAATSNGASGSSARPRVVADTSGGTPMSELTVDGSASDAPAPDARPRSGRSKTDTATPDTRAPDAKTPGPKADTPGAKGDSTPPKTDSAARKASAAAPKPDAPVPDVPAPTAARAAIHDDAIGATESAAANGSSPPPSASASPDLDRLLAGWRELVAVLGQHPPTRALITECRPIAVDGNIVTLGFPESKAFLRDAAERRRSHLEDGIGKFLGRAVAVRCVATNLDAFAALPGDADGERLLVEARRIFGDDLADVGDVS